MLVQQATVSLQRAVQLALAIVGPVLAAFLMALGFGLLFDPHIAEDLGRGGVNPEFRVLLGIAHLLGGMAILVPSLAEQAALIVGVVVSGMAAFLIGSGQAFLAGGPVLTAIVLFGHGSVLEMCHRTAAKHWEAVWLRYAERADPSATEGHR